ncbi:hypothetical protein [Natronococcus occultus]|uniref:hypothetical protein n=1 Tax=Natronococcus occultus TaxID=29288 RepID=UPI0014615E94|nr:hypothetical protein [Natronococcus occultus]
MATTTLPIDRSRSVRTAEDAGRRSVTVGVELAAATARDGRRSGTGSRPLEGGVRRR